MDQPKHRPSLKRHETLQPLSREHMNGLVIARNLKRATTGSPQDRSRVVEEFLHAWHTEIAHHFDDEERLLLDLIDQVEIRNQLLGEHHVLRSLAARIQSDPPAAANEPALLKHVSQLLHDHIRWEERILFELVQQGHPEALDALLHEAQAIEQRRPLSRPRKTLDDWPPKQ